MVASIHGSSILGDLLRLGHVGGVVQLLHGAVGEMHAIDDGGRRGDQVDVEFALEPLADDLKMQKPEKAATEAEAERRRGLHLVAEARVVEAELAHRLAQILELARRRPGTGRRTRPAAPA